MLEAFENWLNNNSSIFTSHGYEFELTKSPTDIDNTSVRLELDSDRYIGRITVWESGDCQLEIIDVESENSVMDCHALIEDAGNFSNTFEEFIEKLNN